MKRRRADMEQKVCSEIRVAIEEVSKICKFNTRSDDSTSTSQQQQSEGGDIVNGGKNCYIAAQPFFNLCNLLIQVLDKIGPSMAVLRQDVHQNIQRLEKLCELDPTIYSNLVEVLRKEQREGKARDKHSCTRALVWLTRSMDFTAALLEKVVKEEPSLMSMEKAVEESYITTLKPWHGWISAAAYKVALKLVPERKNFIKLLMAEDEDHETLKEEINSLVSLLVPLLDEIHSTLIIFRADRLRSN